MCEDTGVGGTKGGNRGKGKASANKGQHDATTTPKHDKAATPNQPSKAEIRGAKPSVAFATVATTGGVSRIPVHQQCKGHIALCFPCDLDATKGDASTP